MAAAIDGFLSTLDHPESAGTRRVYAGTLRALRTHLGPAAPLAVLDDPATAAGLVDWFTRRWANAAPATFNRNLDTLCSAIGYWHEQEWLAGDPTRALRRRGHAPDHTRALDRQELTDLLGRDDIALREKTLWRMLYESAARAGEVLAAATRPDQPTPLTTVLRGSTTQDQADIPKIIASAVYVDLVSHGPDTRPRPYRCGGP